MFERAIKPVIATRLQQFPVVLLVGPRQSGKTTLLEQFFSSYHYINLESPEQLDRMKLDPKTMLTTHDGVGLIIDEAQHYPELCSYIQVLVDHAKRKGQFILSGSQNFLLNEQIAQSLAGRVGVLELLPLSFKEYQTHSDLEPLSIWSWLYQGGYPRPYQDHIPIKIWMDNYVRTYLERDVRSLLKVRDLNLFQRFLKLCAGRHGQLLNTSQLAIDCGISHTTVMQWLSILEASYLIFRLPPYHQNFNKRVIKSPKLYFYDSGLVCYLLGIDSPEHLSLHVSRGAIFEGYVLSELKKYFANRGLSQALYFWRDSYGDEIDCVMECQGKLLGFEIKSTSTFRADLLKGLKKWQTISQSDAAQIKLIYAGDQGFQISGVDIIPWNTINDFFDSNNHT